MFTGIIEEIGTVTRITDLGGGKRLTIEAAMAPELRVDQSVSINGACQTVVDVDAETSTFAVDSIEETLRKTTFGGLEAGTPVNLERALQAGDRLDGHFVQGHVDATGTVTAVEQEETDWLYTIRRRHAHGGHHSAHLPGDERVDGVDGRGGRQPGV